MFVPFAIGLGSIAAGSAIAFVPGAAKRALGPARTFALTAALGVVLAHLLPEALDALGVMALVGLAVGFAGPFALEFLGHRALVHSHGKNTRSPWTYIAAHTTFAGLLVHQVGDGMGLAAFSNVRGADFDVAMVLGAHTIPIAMLVVLGPVSEGARGRAIAKAAALGVATVIGIALGHVVPESAQSIYAPWTAAFASGLLLHVLGHGMKHDLPDSNADRSFDLAAALLGIVLVLFGDAFTADHDVFASALKHDFARALYDLALETAPMLLVGLVLGAVVHAAGGHVPTRLLTGRSAFGSAFRGAMLGAPLPVCACGTIPVARSLQRRGATPAFIAAFLFATPELGIDTFALTARFLGVRFAVVRVGLSIALAILGGVIVSIAHEPSEQQHAHEEDEPQAQSFSARFVIGFDELLFHTGPWVIVGLIGAAFVQALVPEHAFTSIPPGLDVLLVSAIALPSYVCATSATPLAAVLIARGLSPGAALIGLLLGPIVNLGTLSFLRRSYGLRAALGSVTVMIALSWVTAFAFNSHASVDAHVTIGHVAEHGHGPLTIAAAITLVALLVRGLWTSGVRAWFASLTILGEHDHDHGDDHHTHASHAAHHCDALEEACEAPEATEQPRAHDHHHGHAHAHHQGHHHHHGEHDHHDHAHETPVKSPRS